MVTPKTQFSLKNAKGYFMEHLAHGDYYTEKQTVSGEWMGAGCARLGLQGPVRQDAFMALCDGLNPATGEQLTARKNTVRNVGGIEQANRRVFFDFVFRPPKSVSLVALCQDARMIALHDEAVRLAVRELETLAATRVRMNGARENRGTGNFVASLFRHDSSRDLDPLLHTHCVVFNATFDEVEDRWKALENSAMLMAQKLVSAVYDAHLTAGMVKLGYAIRREGQSFEVETVKRTTIEKFSKRRREIEAIAAEVAAKAGGTQDLFAVRDRVAHDHRARKRKNANAETLREVWRTAMSADELAALQPSRLRGFTGSKEDLLPKAVQIADEILFERHSVVERSQLEAAILTETLGSGATLADVRAVLDGGRYVRAKDGTEFASQDGLAAELAVLEAARDGRQTCLRLAPDIDLERTILDDEQKRATTQILASRDFITLFRGAAGTGKTVTLGSVVQAIESAGTPVVVVAPQTGQVRDFVKEGIAARTLTSLVWQGRLAAGAVVILDEAGQVGGRQMHELVKLCKANGARLVLSGDTRQHGAVEASDALLAIEKYSGLKAAEIRTIRRQDERWGKSADESAKIGLYKKAVQVASEGRGAESLALLKGIGALEKVSASRRVDQVAAAVVEDLRTGVDVLAVTQTREEAAAINDAVSAGAEEAGLVADVRPVEVLVPRDLMKGEKKLGRSYAAGDEIIFIGRYGRNRPGDVVRVVHVEENAVMLAPRNGEMKASRLSLAHAEKWNLVDRKELQIGIGTVVQMKLNAVSEEGHKIINGELCRVQKLEEDGRMQVRDSAGQLKTLKADQRALLLGYCVTSYSAQGKSVESVIVSDSGSRLATHREGWYVSISRARRKIRVFTSDVPGLAERIGRPGGEKLAIEIDREERPRLSPARRLALGQTFGARLARTMREIVGRRKRRL